MTDEFARKVLSEFGFPALFAIILLFIIDRHAKLVSVAQVKLMTQLGKAVEVIQKELVEIRVTQALITAKILGEVKVSPIPTVPFSSIDE